MFHAVEAQHVVNHSVRDSYASWGLVVCIDEHNNTQRVAREECN
jgi:hypothetical protein